MVLLIAALVVISAVRHLIGTARLNRHVLHTHAAEPVLALLAPHRADEARKLLRPGDGSRDLVAHHQNRPGVPAGPGTPLPTENGC